MDNTLNTVPETDSKSSGTPSAVTQHEDTALKLIASYFGRELANLAGIEESLTFIGQTEQTSVKIEKSYQDFTYLTESGKIIHFEFQSDNGGIHDLRRFRAYDSIASFQNKTEVITYVFFSGHIQEPMDTLIETTSTYKIIPITLYTRDADALLVSIRAKIQAGQTFTKDDLVNLSLIPLMGGKSSQLTKMFSAMKLIRRANNISSHDRATLEAVLFLFADKFLSQEDKFIFKEEFSMMDLTKLIYDDGIAKGRSQGKAEGKAEGIAIGEEKGIAIGEKKGQRKACLDIAHNLLDLLDDATISTRTNLPIETVISLRKEFMAPVK